MKKFIPLVTTLFITLIISCYSKGDGQSLVESQFNKAASIEIGREELGNQFLKILSDGNYPIHTRIQSAEALGKVIYLPAIPKLIELISLKDPKAISSEADPRSVYKCVDALANYGISASPFIVEAYSIESKKDRQMLLFSVIIYSKTENKALIYARGLLFNADEKNRENLKSLILSLEKIKK